MYRKPVVVPRNETKAFFDANPKLQEIVQAGVEAGLYFSGADERRSIELELSPALVRVYETMVYWREYRDLPFEFQAATTFLDNLLDALFVGVEGLRYGLTQEGKYKARELMRFLIWRTFGDHEPDQSIVSFEYEGAKAR